MAACARPLSSAQFVFVRQCAHTGGARASRHQQKAPPVPVDVAPPVPVAGPIPHFRKLAFVFGAGATLLALILVQQLGGLMP